MAENTPKRLLVFTDLDGTLLDHQTYDFTPALPMLRRLAAMGTPVVLASSKTAAEISLWQDRLGLGRWPAIVENGAAVFEGTFDDRPYRRLCTKVHALNAPFRGFSDMMVDEVCALTGLSESDAILARRREYTEPGIWQGPEPALAAFLKQLQAQGISGRRGGRFLTLGYGGTKAARMDALIARFRPDLTVALGDAPNDVEMLLRADRGIIIRNDHGPGVPHLPGEDIENGGRILRTQASGPGGWQEGLSRILATLSAT
ncbi:MAG TPA: HAD hydrolase family protein [Paenirhodobacter sp.]